MVARATRWPLLAPRLAASSLRPHHLPHHAGRWLGGRVPQQLAAHVRCAPMPEGPADGAVEPHVDGNLAPRSPHRPGARDDPVVRPLAARRGQWRRPGATDPRLRPPRHPAGAGPGRARGRVAGRAGMAPGAVVNAGSDAGRQRRRCPRGAARRRHQRVDLLRRAAAVGPTAGPARGRRLVAGVRLAGGRGPRRDPRPPSGAPHAAQHGPSGVDLRQAQRCVPGRHLGSRHPRHAEPDPPHQLHGAGGDAHRGGGGCGRRARSGRLCLPTGPSHPALTGRHRLAQHLAPADPRELVRGAVLDQAAPARPRGSRSDRRTATASTRRTPRTRTRTGIGTTHDRSGG